MMALKITFAYYLCNLSERTGGKFVALFILSEFWFSTSMMLRRKDGETIHDAGGNSAGAYATEFKTLFTCKKLVSRGVGQYFLRPVENRADMLRKANRPNG